MTILKTVLLIINILSFAVVIIFLPLGFCEFFAGRQRAEDLFSKLSIKLSYKQVEILFFVCLAIAFATYIIRDQIK